MIYYTRLRYQVSVYRTIGPLFVFSCGSLACFWCQSFGDVSPYVGSYIFSSVSVSEWPPFGKKLLTRSIICSRYILTICV